MINIQCLCVSSCCPRMTCGCRIESFLRWIFNECICPVLILFSDFLWDFRIPRFEKVLKAIECISVLLWETLSKQLYWFSLKSFKEKGLSSFCWLAFRYRPWNLFCTGLDFFVQNKTKQMYVRLFLEDSRECQLATNVWKAMVWQLVPWDTMNDAKLWCTQT